ncbi:diaminopimelate epimerase [Lysobacter sp. CFH 32150]|uniref:diaminopimelate epimerase n=1 Tax=Lysobacter sp. CFH 32150 TaxID=2927128 RepID=UPI001FA76CC4|nr:diaminopimelate epimerase [Lysobacter sp. CFH 32150]MCI4568179.1 diaminopimelate epimerase [Lysobacter sp. CFH 32150]
MAERTTGLRFSKMQGAGNDFVVLDLRDGIAPPSPELSRTLADRHFGVGCDQILTIEPPRSEQAIASYRIWNADGSNAQQCGNGARCIAAWLVRDGAIHGDSFTLDSPTGTHVVTRLPGDRYAIAMGVPQFAPQAVPLLGYHDAQDEYALDIDGGAVHFGAASMGNPHALVEVNDIATAPVEVLGPALQADAAFPQSVNVGFAEIDARDRIRLRVYERGAGETLACGSGACAAAAILMRRGRVDREITVSLPGGDLQIAWPEDGASIVMAGPAAFVFEGEFIA